MKQESARAASGPAVLSFFTRVIPPARRGSTSVLLFVGLLIFGVVAVAREWRAPLQTAVEIDLSLAALPCYTFFSLCRGLVAFVLSLLRIGNFKLRSKGWRARPAGWPGSRSRC